MEMKNESFGPSYSVKLSEFCFGIIGKDKDFPLPNSRRDSEGYLEHRK